jgi:translation initiation factor 2B subunit (eIF-2B alpha/beta/delta family)
MLYELQNDNISGANDLVNKILKIFKYQLQLISDAEKDITDIIYELSNAIINSQPSMAPLINAIGYLINDLEYISKNKIVDRIRRFNNEKILKEKALENIFQKFIAKKIEERLRIMTISYSSTIINLLSKFNSFNIELFILESRPLLEGHRTSEILSKYFKTHLIIDAAMGKFIDQLNLVLVGIDSILRDGSVINKIGTYPLAVLAYEKGIDFYAIGESSKYNLKSHYGLEVNIEQKPTKEIYDMETINDNLIISNYYFDITPSKYITGIISELGVLKPQKFLKKVKDVIPVNWFQRFLKNNN